MEGKRFDQLARAVATSGSRRRLLGAVLTGALGSLRIHATSADDGIAIADASGGDHNVATVVDPAPSGNDRDHDPDRDHDDDTCARAGELRKDGKPCCNDLVKDNDDRCVRPQSSDGSLGTGGSNGGSGGGNEGGAVAQCNLNPCPPDQTTGSTDSGRCCDDGFCTCGGACCGGPDCWIHTESFPVGDGEQVRETSQEVCTPADAGCVICPITGEEVCCPDCSPEGPCGIAGQQRGASIRRRPQ
jgi:hypothetical protein